MLRTGAFHEESNRLRAIFISADDSHGDGITMAHDDGQDFDT